MTYITINFFKTTSGILFLFLLLLILYSAIRQTIKILFLTVLYIIQEQTIARCRSLVFILFLYTIYITNKRKQIVLSFLIYTGTKKQTTAHFVRVSLAASSISRSRSLSRLYILLYIITLRVLSINTIYKYYTITARSTRRLYYSKDTTARFARYYLKFFNGLASLALTKLKIGSLTARFARLTQTNPLTRARIRSPFKHSRHVNRSLRSLDPLGTVIRKK